MHMIGNLSPHHLLAGMHLEFRFQGCTWARQMVVLTMPQYQLLAVDMCLLACLFSWAGPHGHRDI